jgi:hypothetical protein
MTVLNLLRVLLVGGRGVPAEPAWGRLDAQPACRCTARVLTWSRLLSRLLLLTRMATL